MNKEYDLLVYLHNNEYTSQRQIALNTGLSLGAVNLTLKRMTRKGLLKMEKLNARTMRYILTSKGMNEKAKIAYRYIRRSYSQIVRISNIVTALVCDKQAQHPVRQVYVYGPDDEIREILLDCMRKLDVIVHLSEPGEPVSARPDMIILVWRNEDAAMASVSSRVYNIMHYF